MIRVEFTGPVRRPDGQAVHLLERGNPVTVESLLDSLGFSRVERRFLLVVVNNDVARLSTRVADGDSVLVGILVGGG